MALLRGKLFAGALFAGALLAGSPQEQAQAAGGGAGGSRYAEPDIIRLVHEKYDAIEQAREDKPGALASVAVVAEHALPAEQRPEPAFVVLTQDIKALEPAPGFTEPAPSMINIKLDDERHASITKSRAKANEEAMFLILAALADDEE